MAWVSIARTSATADLIPYSFFYFGLFCSVRRGCNWELILCGMELIVHVSRYWAIPFDAPEYNFAQYMLDEGYAVFFYDRLGVGNSSRYVLLFSVILRFRMVCEIWIGC